MKGSVQLKALLEEEDTALPLQSEDKEGRKISSRIEAATNSEEEDRLVSSSEILSHVNFVAPRKIVKTAKSCQWTLRLPYWQPVLTR